MKAALFLTLLFVFSAPVFSGGGKDLPRPSSMGRSPEDIKKAGVLRAGVHSDFPKFGVKDAASGGFFGYEVELARMLAKEMLGDPEKVEFFPVPRGREPEILDGVTADIVIATFGLSSRNAAHYNISQPYFVDCLALMVAAGSSFTGLASLDGHSIGVIRGSTARSVFEMAAASAGARPRFYEFTRGEDAKAAMDAGLLDCFAAERSYLARFMDGTMRLLHETQTPREYGIVTKLSNSALAYYVEQRIAQWTKTGLFDTMIAAFGIY